LALAGPLKLIQQPSAGYEHIDIKACSERGIRVANAPTANTVSVAEHTIAMGLALLRKLVPANRGVREGRWEQMTLQPYELAHKTWGLVGLGEIGRAVALRLRPFGLTKVLYYDPHQAPKEVEEQYGVEYSPPAGAAEIQRCRESAPAIDRFHAEHDWRRGAFDHEGRGLSD
jgi:phosphoglycerate dehydrogenase-like enzyme